MKAQLPQNPDGKVYLHLGCGDIASPEFINIDIHPAPHVHYVRDATDLSVFVDNYADLVYACHIFEHIPCDRLRETLGEWKRVLKPGGILRLSVPGFDELLSVYGACGHDVESIRGPLLGGWDGYPAHCMIFNFSYLQQLLSDLGFSGIRKWVPSAVDHHAFDDWASRCIERNGKKHHISLNVEGVKPDRLDSRK